MTDQWMIRGMEFSNCNCDYGCPCQFNSPSTHGFCEAIGSVIIEEGHFNDTTLDGLRNGRQQFIIDQRADEKQREAIRKIAHGESTKPGATHFYVFNSTMKEVLDPVFAPIEMEIDVEARRARTRIEGLVESSGRPVISPFNGEEERMGIHLPGGFEYTYAEIGSASSRVNAGIALDMKDSYGQFNILHMNQDGVIR